MNAPVISASPDGPGSLWLRSKAFDAFLIFGVLAIALAMGLVASISPALFLTVLTIDVWLFAYPHVTSTYTRIAFDRESIRRHWFLLLGLPPLVLAATSTVAALWSVGGLFTVYFVWQTYHYTRQSFGIARAYRRKGPRAGAPDWLADAVIYVFPLWGLLHRAAQGHKEFYGYPLFLLNVPAFVAQGAGVIAIALGAVWAVREARRWINGDVHPGHAMFVATHVFITTLSYVLFADITSGWLFINIWHNAQYLMFVWAQNARRFAGGANAQKSRFLAYLCQPRNALQYLAFCILFGAAQYELIKRGAEQLAWTMFPVILVLYLTVNFHHYLVDSVIWKRKAARSV